jgi:hypothetical protein
MLNDWITLTTRQNKKNKTKTNNMELLDKLNWRYAAKAMNGTKVPQEKLTTSLKRSHLSNFKWFTTFEVIVITNQEERKIRPIS